MLGPQPDGVDGAAPDDGALADEGRDDDGLFAELQTTAVYDRVGAGEPERHVLTLRAAAPEYQELEQGNDGDDQAVSAPEIVVQIRKRNGTAQLLVEGFVSVPDTVLDAQGQPVACDLCTHPLDFHKGLHEDWETNTRVFSPIAIVAAVEDGQHPLQNVKVGVLQVVESAGEPVGEPTLLEEVNVVPHRVADVRCAVVRAPYPLTFAPQPTVAIQNNYKQQYEDKKTYLQSFKLGVATTMTGFLTKAAESGAAYAFSTVLVSTGLTMAISTLMQSVGLTGWAVVTATIGRELANVVAMPASGGDNLTPEQAKTLSGAVALGVYNYVTKATPDAKDKTIHLTLAEFAKTLEEIAALKKHAADADDTGDGTPQMHANYKNQRAVWSWLCDKDLANLDTGGMVLNVSSTTSLRIRISIDDPMACDADVQHHELYCGRADRCALGAAASGAEHAITRVRNAILKVVYMLNYVTDPTYEPGGAIITWIEYSMVQPLWYFVTSLSKEYKDKGLKGVWRNHLKSWATEWQKQAGADSEQYFTKWVYEATQNIKAKLLDPFFSYNGAAATLLRTMDDALRSKRVPLPRDDTTWIRRLPQRVRAQNSTRLFARTVGTDTQYADIDTEDGVVVREFTKYASAVKALDASLKKGRLALRRFAKEWEAHKSTWIALDCKCERIEHPRLAFKPARCHSSLALTTPVDIQFASAIVSISERTLRHIRLVVKRARQQCDKSILEALGLRHTNADLLATQIFGELWVAELLAMHESFRSRQVQMLEQASSRAAARLGAAGRFLLRLVAGNNPSTNLTSEEYGDTAPSRTDIALVATQAGRDAALLLDRVLFSQDYVFVRAAMVPLIRNCAYTAVRAASAFERAVPTRLPHGPTASLFGDSHDGVAAYLRATRLSTDAAVARTITAAYPATLLLDGRTPLTEDEVAALRNRTPRRRDNVRMTSAQLVETMRFRLASLQMQPTIDDAENLSVDDLAEALAVVKVSGGARSFYVPFGFGDARPAPTLPPCAAPLFGTVPVFGDALVHAFDSIRVTLRGEAPAETPKAPFCVRLEPMLDCLEEAPANPEVESVHPNVIQLRRETDCVVASFVASRAPKTGPVDTTPATTEPTVGATEMLDAARRAAATHKCDVQATSASATVSSIAWNAERIVQSVVAAVASADPAVAFDAIEVELDLPPDGTERSHWYEAPANVFQVEQEHRRNELLARELVAHVLMLVGVHKNVMVQKLLKDPTPPGPVALAQMFPDLATAAAAPGWTGGAWVGLMELHLETFGAGSLSEAEIKKLKELRDAAAKAQETLDEHLRKYPNFVSNDADVGVAQRAFQIPAPPPPAQETTSNAPSRRALVGALGVGMGMLVPLLGDDLRVTCRAVRGEEGESADAVEALKDAFGNCPAVRLSEACFLVSRSVG